MASHKPPRLRAGHQLYDPINGIRVGALAGALVAAGIVVLFAPHHPWLIVAGGVVGAVTGFLVGHRQLGR